MIIDRLWRDQPGKFFCISTKSASGKWRDNFFSRNELGEVGKFIEDNKNCDLYFCPHGFSQKMRRKSAAVLPKLLWSDLDEADPRKVKFRPSIAIESSPGRYVGLWLLDDTMTEEMNRRLSYSLEGDHSGWDLTQVLRIPGTINYKYQSLPRTRILWSDGPEYSVRDFKSLPSPDSEGGRVDDDAAREVYKNWEKKLPHWCRRELLNAKVGVGKRSEMLWKLGNTLIESGVDREDAFVLLKASAWNKFRGRRNEDEQLWRELEKSVDRHLKGGGGRKGEEKKLEDDYRWLARALDEVVEENIDWLWYPYLARGEVTIIEGDPERGKSYLAQMISGHFCDGKKLPGAEVAVKGRVAYFDIENTAGSVTVKRMRGNGFKHLENYFQEEAIFSIDDDERVAAVCDAIDKMRPLVLVFDTINTYLGKADAFKGHEAQQAFIRFREMAKRYNCAVVVLRHLTKSSRERALYRGQGNIAMTGVARVVITVGAMPDDPDTRVMAVTKLNIAKKPKALTFTIDQAPGKDKDKSIFRWGEFVDITSDELVNANTEAKGGRPSNEREAATVFLKEQLAGGGKERERLERMAEARNISARTLERAADKLQVVRRISGFGKTRCSVWSLPTE